MFRLIQERLDVESNPEVRASYERLVPGAKVMGVKVPMLRSLAKEYGLGFEASSLYLDFAAEAGIREEMLFGIFALAKWKKLLVQLEWLRLGRWIPAINNWEVCDQLAANVVAPLVYARLELEPHLQQLANLPNAWERRLALATSASMNQKGRESAALTELLCTLLEGDKNPMIRKAVAWARRERAKALARH